MSKIKGFIFKEPVLCAAVLLAVVSGFFIPPDTAYIDYIDFRTLSLLFCLMAVMAGLREAGVFEVMAQKLLLRVKTVRSMVLILWLLCFFSSMLITNDVALITFVPFTIILLSTAGAEKKKKWLIPAAVSQTIAANLGSMLTPIGNPQNLYLYGKAEMGIGEFIMMMLPYTAASLFLLMLWTFIFCRDTRPVKVDFPEEKKINGAVKPIIYLVLFLLCLAVVVHILPYYFALGITVLYLLIADRRLFAKVDYSLLLTFIGFFVFIGNMGRIDVFRDFLGSVIEGNETLTAVISSQAISNVPAALLLSGFTDKFSELIIGTNLGGLGTLIASMASLISFKFIAAEEKTAKLPYLIYFTVANVVFLVILLGMYYFI